MARRSLGIVALLVLWQVLSGRVAQPAFPSALVVLTALGKAAGTPRFWGDVGYSVWVVSVGFISAAIPAFLVGTLIAHQRSAAMVLLPLVGLMKPVAAVSVFPLFIIFLGLGLAAKGAVIAWAVWPAVVLNTLLGYEEVFREHSPCIEAARMDGATVMEELYHVSLPLAAPSVFTGLRLGLAGGWIAVISAEMLSATKGLGHAVLVYSNSFRFPELFAMLLSIACVGALMSALCHSAQRLYEQRRLG